MYVSTAVPGRRELKVNVSILITSCNQINYLMKAVDSALRQSRPPCEIIISDDCSDDGSQEYIHRLQKTHPGLVRGFFHPRRLGIPKNKSFAIEKARGDWIIGLDENYQYALVGSPSQKYAWILSMIIYKENPTTSIKSFLSGLSTI